jgi:hypothetical protein
VLAAKAPVDNKAIAEKRMADLMVVFMLFNFFY